MLEVGIEREREIATAHARTQCVRGRGASSATPFHPGLLRQHGVADGGLRRCSAEGDLAMQRRLWELNECTRIRHFHVATQVGRGGGTDTQAGRKPTQQLPGRVFLAHRDDKQGKDKDT